MHRSHQCTADLDGSSIAALRTVANAPLSLLALQEHLQRSAALTDPLGKAQLEEKHNMQRRKASNIIDKWIATV